MDKIRNERMCGPVGKGLALKWAFLMILFTVTACAWFSHYDPTSYQRATDLKAESLLLMAKATDPPEKHVAEIAAVQLKLQQAYEYEKGKGKPNMITVEQWKLLKDPNGALLGGFLNKWQTEKKGRSEVFIVEASKNVSQAFDQIIKLENAKVKD